MYPPRRAGALTRHLRLLLMLAAATGVLSAWSTTAACRVAGDPFVDPLDTPSASMPSPQTQPLLSITRAGQRLVGVGMRGLILLSDDDGKHWQQRPSPVATDLIAAAFPTPLQGWVVGHNNVVLHTADGGLSWTKQLDGRRAAIVLEADYLERIRAGDTSLQPFLDQLVLNDKAGPSLPLLSVWFKDALHGTAVGAFGMVIRTDDGGKTWHPWLEHVDNPQFLHLNAIVEIDGEIYIAAEQGALFQFDATSSRFRLVQTDYAGSFFGITGSKDVLIAYGLRGTLYRSTDRGASWHRWESPLHATVTGGVYDASHASFAFVTAAGEIAVNSAATTPLHLLHALRPAPFTGIQTDTHGALIASSLAGPIFIGSP